MGGGARLLEEAEVYWLTTVRPDGRPHVTPLLAIWLDGALYFSTGASERKAKNLAQNAHCVLTTGCNALNEGLDLVVEGDAATMRDEATLQRVADLYAAKYGPDWRFTVRDGAFQGAAATSRWCTKSRPRRHLASAKAHSARPAGTSRRRRGPCESTHAVAVPYGGRIMETLARCERQCKEKRS